MWSQKGFGDTRLRTDGREVGSGVKEEPAGLCSLPAWCLWLSDTIHQLGNISCTYQSLGHHGKRLILLQEVCSGLILCFSMELPADPKDTCLRTTLQGICFCICVRTQMRSCINKCLNAFPPEARTLAIAYLCVYSHCHRVVHIMPPLINHHSKGDNTQTDLRHIDLLRRDLFNKQQRPDL